jgi:hypothetical protein
MAAVLGHRIEAVVEPDGRITLRDLPLRPGERVEVTVFPVASGASVEQLRERLRGSVLRDDDPFGSASPTEDWEAAG